MYREKLRNKKVYYLLRYKRVRSYLSNLKGEEGWQMPIW